MRGRPTKARPAADANRAKARTDRPARMMRVHLGAALLAIAVSSTCPARAGGTLTCEREMTRAAALNGVPLNVLYSVGLTETGRRGELSPMT